MLSPEVISKIQRIELRAGHLVSDALSGEYLSAFKGRGMEFDEVRTYIPGDDVRTIDWNVTARMQAPYVKVMREEREQTLVIMVDSSASQRFGSVARTKQELSAELAAVLAFLATRNNDKVGLIVFSDIVEKYIPPKKGRGHVWRIIQEVLTHSGQGRRTDLAGAMKFMNSVVRRRSTCFVISDFRGQSLTDSFRQVRKRHELIAALVTDPRESLMADVGLIAVEDSESGRRMLLPTMRRAGAGILNVKEEKWRDSLKRQAQQLGVGMMQLTTDQDLVRPLENLMMRRLKRQGRRAYG